MLSWTRLGRLRHLVGAPSKGQVHVTLVIASAGVLEGEAQIRCDHRNLAQVLQYLRAIVLQSTQPASVHVRCAASCCCSEIIDRDQCRAWVESSASMYLGKGSKGAAYLIDMLHPMHHPMHA
jgi:hypothetical protein